jgi:hypothetical protein
MQHPDLSGAKPLDAFGALARHWDVLCSSTLVIISWVQNIMWHSFVYHWLSSHPDGAPLQVGLGVMEVDKMEGYGVYTKHMCPGPCH